jgi:hypothetical protein
VPQPNPKNLQQRVFKAADSLLKHDGSVGPLELLQEMNFLSHAHVKSWKQGLPQYSSIEPSIQCGEKKLQQTYQHFHQWVKQSNLEPFTATYTQATRSGAQPLKISDDDNEATDTFFRTHFRPANLTAAKKERLEKKANKVPDLLVYQVTSKQSECGECNAELFSGDLIMLEGDAALCLSCADMDHLEFLPSGDAAMTRRSKKASPLSAIVMRFNQRRKRYQRMGMLVTSAAIDAAEQQCDADAEQRAERRARAAVSRAESDVELVEEMIALIATLFPGCPADEARQIASHTAVRGSGRVGRSAAGRDLQDQAIELAVGAHVRHQHTNYDELLMQGVERQDARKQISPQQREVLSQWKSG